MAERALYVYGVIPRATPADIFDGVRGIDPNEPIFLVRGDDVAAITSAVDLDEFGPEAIEGNLRDAAWLADKARAHDDVLAAALDRTTVVPFRFGGIYSSEDQIQNVLRERRDLEPTLNRLNGSIELGVKGYVNVATLADRLADRRQPDEELSAGRAYLERKQAARASEDAVRQFMSDCAEESHRRLLAVARAGRSNPVRQIDDPAGPNRMLLNAAYLVDRSVASQLGEELRALERAYAAETVRYELTGPWPPYNFIDDAEES